MFHIYIYILDNTGLVLLLCFLYVLVETQSKRQIFIFFLFLFFEGGKPLSWWLTGVINSISFGVKIIGFSSRTISGNECCAWCQSFELKEGGEEGGKKVVFLFWKTAETLHHGRLIYCNGPQKKKIFLISLNFRNASPWACQKHLHGLTYDLDILGRH